MKTLLAILTIVCMIGPVSSLLKAQNPDRDRGTVYMPSTSVERPEDTGRRAHTNHLILIQSRRAPTGGSPSGLTPSNIRAAYNLPASNIGGSGVIAIVDAYDYPTAAADFDTFSTEFSSNGAGDLPLSSQSVCNGSKPCFQVVHAGGTKPKANCGWAQEAALDIEWAHAMAPFAQIVLVEAQSSSFTDLFAAVDVATNEVLCGAATCPSGSKGEGEVTMSWGGREFSSETNFDSHFNGGANIVYFAATGDSGGKTIYPSVSPFVVAAGGTTLNTSGDSFVSETGWSSSGGGKSAYEPIPTFQSVTGNLGSIVGTQRGVPDYSFDSDPSTGVSVFDSTACQGLSGWMVFGGTSVASPSLSGIVNSAGGFRTSADELNTIYATFNSSSYSTDFRDIISGKAAKFKAATGWDFVTGVGSNLTLNGK